MTLKEKVNTLKLKPSDAPPGMNKRHFGNILSAIRNDRPVSMVSSQVVELICDIDSLLKGGKVTLSYGKAIELSKLLPTAKEANEATPANKVNCQPGTFVSSGGQKIFNLGGTFWTGGESGKISINSIIYEYDETKSIGVFKKYQS